MDTTSPAVLIWTAVAGGTGGFLGASLSALLTYRSRAIDRRREQQRLDGDVLGPVSILLSDANPDRLGFNVSRDMTVQDERMADLRQRANASSGQLLTMAASHPNKEARKLADELAVATGNAITSASWFIRDLVNDRALDYRDTALADHAKAQDLLNRLRDVIAKAR
jgi:hypothetical protein